MPYIERDTEYIVEIKLATKQQGYIHIYVRSPVLEPVVSCMGVSPRVKGSKTGGNN